MDSHAEELACIRGMAQAVLVESSGFAVSLPEAAEPGVRRIALLQQDLAASGQQVIQMRVEFRPGSESACHSHPGQEIVYVLRGALEYGVEGVAPVTLGPGSALFIPAGRRHVARNVGSGMATALVTYLVRKGRPLIVLAATGPDVRARGVPGRVKRSPPGLRGETPQRTGGRSS